MKQSDSKDKYQVCSGCKRASYCSPACQRFHWKEHKLTCKQNQQTLARVVASGDIDGEAALARPGFVNEKLVEDIRKWTKRHTDWLGACYFQAAKLKSSPHFWRTHGVIVVLEPHNTRQTTYKFTFKEAYTLSLTEMQALANEKSQGGVFSTLLKQVPTGKSIEGEALFTAIVFIRCLSILSIVPQVSPFETMNVMSEYSDWQPRLSALLKAPSGINESRLIEYVSPWWQSNRKAIVFCCVNLLGLKKNSPAPDCTVDFELMYSEKGTGDKISYKLTPLPPTKISWGELEQRVAKVRGGIELVNQCKEIRTTRDNGQGKTGTLVVAGPSIIGVSPCTGPWFITDDELEHIEVREDWTHHFYTLLVDYDLRFR